MFLLGSVIRTLGLFSLGILIFLSPAIAQECTIKVDSEESMDELSITATNGAQAFFSNAESYLDKAPPGWAKRFIHPVLNNYYDRSINSNGDDFDADHGIDRSTIFFFVGHGVPGQLNINDLNTRATSSSIRVGNCQGSDCGSILRYFFLCSCRVFANGPLLLGGADGSLVEDFYCPGVPPDPDSTEPVSDVLSLFSKTLDARFTDVRMLCGASTLIRCSDEIVRRIWDNYLFYNLDVSDSFLLALHSRPYYAPICIAPGGLLPQDSAIYDHRYTSHKNAFGSAGNNIEYVEEFSRSALSKVPLLPMQLLTDEVRLFAYKAYVNNIVLTEFGSPAENFKAELERSFFCPRSNDPVMEAFSSEFYINSARRFLIDNGWAAIRDLEHYESLRLMVASVGGGVGLPARIYQKGVAMTFRREIDIGGVKFEDLDGSRDIVVYMANDGSVISAGRKVGSQSVDITGESISLETALDTAWIRLGDSSRNYYKVDYKTWGLKEIDKSLRPVYRFEFMPIGGDSTRHSPQKIDVEALQR